MSRCRSCFALIRLAFEAMATCLLLKVCFFTIGRACRNVADLMVASAECGCPIAPSEAYRMFMDSLDAARWLTMQESTACIKILRPLDVENKMELIQRCQGMIRSSSSASVNAASSPADSAAAARPSGLALQAFKRHVPMRTCLSFPCCLTRTEWATLLDPTSTYPVLLRCLLERCKELGLCNASEPTARAIWCCLLLARTPVGRTSGATSAAPSFYSHHL